MMKKFLAVFVALICFAASSAYAMYTVHDTGIWPKSWPKELDSLRKRSKTYEGPEVPSLHYAIPFTKRDEFESAWQHVLKVRSKGAPIILMHTPNFFLGKNVKAGIVVHSPPAGQTTEDLIPSQSNPRITWRNTTYIELFVDGKIVDLNRIPLPEDAPIIDKRFKDEKSR